MEAPAVDGGKRLDPDPGPEQFWVSGAYVVCAALKTLQTWGVYPWVNVLGGSSVASQEEVSSVAANEERLNEDGGAAVSPQNRGIPESLAAMAAEARKFRKNPILTPQARAHLFYGGRKQRATITVPSVLAGVRQLPPPSFLATGPTVLRHPATQDETLKRNGNSRGEAQP